MSVNTACQELLEHIVELVEADLDGLGLDGLGLDGLGLDGLGLDGLGLDGVARLRVHADTCAACARQVDLQRQVVAALRAQPAAPDLVVPVPNPEPSPVVSGVVRGVAPWGGRLKVAAVAAVAAGLLVVAGARLVTGSGTMGSGTSPVTGTSQVDMPAVVGNEGRIEIRSVVDSTADVALPDDDLLALTAGVEAVVMRRPAQRR